MLKHVDFLPGIVTYDDFDMGTISLLKKMPISEKDLMLVEYPNQIMIDVDWHKGIFFVSIINKYDWDNRVIKKTCKKLDEVEFAVKECVAYVRKMLNEIEARKIGKIKMFEDLDVSPGKILYSDIYLDPALSLNENSRTFPEKLMQIDYPNGNSICVDWNNNEFVISIFNFGQTTIQKKSESLEKLRSDLQESIITIRQSIESENKN